MSLSLEPAEPLIVAIGVFCWSYRHPCEGRPRRSGLIFNDGVHHGEGSVVRPGNRAQNQQTVGDPKFQQTNLATLARQLDG